MYKCCNNLVPDYISDIIPPFVREISNYPLRNRANLTNIYTRTEISNKSCVPSSVSYWNELQSDLREADTFLAFRHKFKENILGDIKIPSFLYERQ